MDRDRRLEEEVALLRAQIAHLPARWGEDGGGNSTENLTKFAVVTVAAGASTHSATGVSFGSTGKAILLDEDYQKSVTESEEIEEAEIEFKSMLTVGLPVDAIVELSSINEIEPGSTWEENKVVAMPVDIRYYPNFGAKRYMGVNGGKPEWRDFETAELDASAECIAGEPVFTITPDEGFVIEPTT